MSGSRLGGRVWVIVSAAALVIGAALVMHWPLSSSAARDPDLIVPAGREVPLPRAVGAAGLQSSDPSIALPLPTGTVVGIRPGFAEITGGARAVRVEVKADRKSVV